MPNITQEQSAINSSYDKSLSSSTRFNDFLGKYHIHLRCDGEYKEAIVDFVIKELYSLCKEHEQIRCKACFAAPDMLFCSSNCECKCGYWKYHKYEKTEKEN